MKIYLYFLKSILSLFLVVIFGLQTGATETEATYEVDGLFYRLFNNRAMVVAPPHTEIKTSTYSGNLVIPSSVTIEEKEYEVSEIGFGAFRGPDINSIFIPNTVIFAYEGTFTDLALDSLSIPDMQTQVLTYENSFTKRMVLRADSVHSSVSIGDRNLQHGSIEVDTLEVNPCRGAHINVFSGVIGQLHFRHLDEVWPDEYVFYHCKDPESPVYIVMDDEVPPVAKGEYADKTTIGGSLLFVPDGTVERYKKAPFWRTARGIYPKSRILELEELLSTHALNEVAIDGKSGRWRLDGQTLIVSFKSGDKCEIYDVAGRFIRSINSNDAVVLQPGSYILTHGISSEKIIVR